MRVFALTQSLISWLTMSLPARNSFRRFVSAAAAATLVVGLLHAPSMMLEEASTAAITDCHAGTGKSAPHSRAADHDAPAAANTDAPSPAPDHHDQAPTSGCPLANIAAFTVSPNELALVSDSSPLSPAPPQELVATSIEPPDPPPRHNS